MDGWREGGSQPRDKRGGNGEGVMRCDVIRTVAFEDDESVGWLDCDVVFFGVFDCVWCVCVCVCVACWFYFFSSQ